MSERIILGIDPSTVSTGWAILNGDNLVACGAIRCPYKMPLNQRITRIYTSLLHIVTEYGVTEIATEDQFGHKNPKTLKSLSNVKGVILLISGQLDIPYYEYMPKYIKTTFTGNGAADKKAMVAEAKARFAVKEALRDDIADAIGVAFTHQVKGAR